MGDEDPATALWRVASKSLARRRQRPSQANVRSTTQRRGKIAVLAGPGVDADKLLSLKAALNAKGAVVHLIAEHGGALVLSDGSTTMVDKPARNAASVFYNGVFVAGGADPAKMAAMGLVKAFIAEAFKHGKAIGAVAAAAQVIKAAHLPHVAAGGSPKLGVLIGDDVGSAFIEALMTPRFHDRDIDAVAA